jgi:hypothetical protein
MQFRLRTLLIVLALGPVALAGVWWAHTRLSDMAWDRAGTDLPWQAYPVILGVLGALFVAAMIVLVVLLKSREA